MNKEKAIGIIANALIAETEGQLGWSHEVNANGLYLYLTVGDRTMGGQLILDTSFASDEVTGYYINFVSRWSSAKDAECLGIVLRTLSVISHKLEAEGLKFHA